MDDEIMFLLDKTMIRSRKQGVMVHWIANYTVTGTQSVITTLGINFVYFIEF